MRYSFYLVIFLGLILSCRSDMAHQSNQISEVTLELPKKPNILWIVAEDLGDYIPSFGDSTITTPHLSRLASEGVCYDKFFSPAAVCAPARSAITTGMYPTHIGSNHMRTGPWYVRDIPEAAVKRFAQNTMPPGIPIHEAIPPVGTKMMSEVLRENGYYCSNNAKEDYQFRRSLMAWDDCSNKAHWRNRGTDQPFFSIFNIGITHESQIWQRAKDSLWVDEDLTVPVPPYLPDTEVGRTDVRRMYSNIKIMDHRVGQILAELEEDGLLEETIIFWYTDHGGPLPRQKRLLYDSGIKVPMIVRYPNGQLANTRNDDLISFIDLAPTVMSLAGIKPSENLDGKAFQGKYEREGKASYIFAAADRFDETYDKNRAVRDKRFKYIKYYEPELPMFLHVAYRDQMPIMQELYRLRDQGILTDAQKLWFREKKPQEELFDVENDPHELINLVDNPEYEEKLNELRSAMSQFQNEIPDLNLKPEKELINDLWPDGVQPVTVDPTFEINNGLVRLFSATEGASLGYQILKSSGVSPGPNWTPYISPFPINEGEKVVAVSHRIGYKESGKVEIEI